MRIERRNKTALGRKRRRDFDRSRLKLRDLGMPRWAIEYFCRVARVAGLPPHMVVCHVAVVVAGRQLHAPTPPEQAGKTAVDGESNLAILRLARADTERAEPESRPRRRSGIP